MSTTGDETGIIVNETGAQQLINYVLDVGQKDKRARCSLKISQHHLNRHNSLHGGIASAILDNAMGATASLTVDETGRAPFMTLSLTIQYLAPAKEGDELTATGKLVGGGRSVKFIDGQLINAQGTIIATATGVFKRVPEHRLAAKNETT